MNATSLNLASSGVIPRTIPEDLRILNPRISANSNYNSPIWNWREDTLDYGQKSYINFGMELGEGVKLSDERFTAINQALRQLLFATWAGWVPESNLLKSTTIANIFFRLLPFIRFVCIERNRNALSEITSSDLDAFLVALRSLDLVYESKERLVRDVCWIWRNHEFIEAKYRPICPCLWQRAPIHRLLGRKPPYEEVKQTQRIPDEVLVPLWNVSMDYLENRAGYLLTLLEEWCRLQEMARDCGHYNKVSADFEKFAAALNTGNDKLLVKDTQTLRREIERLKAAAIFVLGLVFGARVATLLALKPGCINQVTGHNGQAVIWIKGQLFKSPIEVNGIERTWVVGRFGKLAVDVLDKLGASTRRKPGYSRLIVTNHPRSCGDPYGVGTKQQISRSINSLITDENVQTKDGKLWHFHPHQFRRTFVHLVARFADFPISALQGHLGHIANNATRYYLGRDPGLWIEIAEESESLAKRRLGDMLAEPMAGAGGERLSNAINEGIEQGKLPHEFHGYAGEHIRLKLAEELLNSDATWHFQNLNMCRFRSETAVCNPGGTVPLADKCSALTCEGSYISPGIHGQMWVAIENVSSRNLEKYHRSKILAPGLRKQRNEAREVLKRIGLAGKQADA
jgi:hypothetical protein